MVGGTSMKLYRSMIGPVLVVSSPRLHMHVRATSWNWSLQYVFDMIRPLTLPSRRLHCPASSFCKPSNDSNPSASISRMSAPLLHQTEILALGNFMLRSLLGHLC